MAQLEMFFLGSFQVLLDGELLTEFESNKDRALLAYLAVEQDRPHSREKLADLLWPRQDRQAGRSNLRHSLSKLRKILRLPGKRTTRDSCSFLIATRQTIQFNEASNSWGDWQPFGLTNPDINQLEQMAALYRGPFLDGCCLADSPAFDQWVLCWRERLQRQALEGLHRLVEIYAVHGGAGHALPYAWRQVELEPWREAGQRQLIWLLAANGQRGAALEQFGVCRDTLAERFGVTPAAETVALATAIREGSFERDDQRLPAGVAAPVPAQQSTWAWLTAVLLSGALAIGFLFRDRRRSKQGRRGGMTLTD